MHVIGIVGHGKDKFTPEGAKIARKKIDHIITEAMNAFGADDVIICSGHSPVGGVDIWAEDIATELHIQTRIYPSTSNAWDGPGGYKERNLKIAETDEVHVILVDKYPPHYHGRTFPSCYHCDKHPGTVPTHVKSGGCWTGWKAYDFGKPIFFHVVKNKE